MHQQRLKWLSLTVSMEAMAIATLARAHGLEPPDLAALEQYLHTHMRRSMLDDPLGCLKPEWLPELHLSEIALNAMEALSLSAVARSELAKAYGARSAPRAALARTPPSRHRRPPHATIASPGAC